MLHLRVVGFAVETPEMSIEQLAKKHATHAVIV